jgi:hypothetical protein
MKVNPVSIQAYQQPAPKSEADPAARRPAEKPAPESAIQIGPQKETAGSRLAVRPPTGTYAEFLSPEEKQALDILFSRFRDSNRFGSAYRADQQADQPETGLGQVVDVKV